MSRPAGLGDFEYQGRKDGLLLVECWCQGDLVLVAPEAVRVGLTGSCGGDDCSSDWEPPAAPRTLWAVLDWPIGGRS